MRTARSWSLKLRRSFRRALLFGALLTSLIPHHALANEASQCKGYRYAYIREVGSKVQFHACKRILEPSSRPVDCQNFGEIEIEEARKKLKSKTYSFIAGYSLGLACSLAGYFASKISAPVGGGIAMYNYGAQKLSVDEMQNDVRDGKRKLGESPLRTSHYQSAGRTLCTYFTEMSHTWFAVGTRQAVGHIATFTMESEAMHADARLIWSAPIEHRQRMFDEYQRNIQKREERRVRAINTGAHVLQEIAQYALSNEITNVPFGLTDEIAIVPANSCIPAIDVVKAAESLRSLPRRVDDVMRSLQLDEE